MRKYGKEPAKFKDNVNKVGVLKVAEELHQVGVGHCLVKPAHETQVRNVPITGQFKT